MTAIEFNNISKQYRLGLVSTRTLSHDLNRWWQMNVLRKDDPYLKIGEVNDRAHKGESDYVWALKDINFKVEQGDVLGIIGKNGAGKSTLLKILSKVTAPTTGTIKARGRIASLLEVGTGFHPEMTGRENIFMNGSIMGMTKSEIARKLDEIIDFAGVERYIDTPVKRYSSGMTVRLGFAIAAHLEPEILVVDEVLAVGDAEFQKKAIGKMQDVSKGEGRTVLFVSHNMPAVKNLCTTGIILENGRLTYAGTAIDAVTKYVSNKTSVESLGKVIDNIKYNTNKIRIDSITINNSEDNTVTIDDDNNTLDIKIKGELFAESKVSIEIKVFDLNDLPLLFYSPDHEKPLLRTLEVGGFEINKRLVLPKGMAKGEFYADIYITNPMVEGLVDIHNAFQISSQGHSTETGFVFEYSKGHGWLFSY